MGPGEKLLLLFCYRISNKMRNLQPDNAKTERLLSLKWVSLSTLPQGSGINMAEEERLVRVRGDRRLQGTSGVQTNRAEAM